MNQELLAGLLFICTYALIISERVHRTLVALFGGMLMIILGVISQEEAYASLDLNVIFLLAGMMMIAGLLGETGVFQWIAITAVKLGRGNPVVIMIIIAAITAVASALLDNVTVVVLIAPVTLYVASTLGVSPIPFLIVEVLSSNIGGAATLIGDPPNILIASAADIDFVTFVVNMGPPALIILILYLSLVYYQYRNKLQVPEERKQAVMRLETKGLIRKPKLLWQSVSVLLLVLTGFFLQAKLQLEPGTVAIFGATLLLIISQKDPADVLEKVEWATLFFFIGLFIIVEGLVKAGLIERVAQVLLDLTGGNLPFTTIFILWFSAISSGIVDNIPYTATMIPLIQDLASSMNIEPLWWALALGADLGGNLTLIGASANLVVASLSERSGYKLSFGEFTRYGIQAVLLSLVVSSIWLWLVVLR